MQQTKTYFFYLCDAACDKFFVKRALKCIKATLQCFIISGTIVSTVFTVSWWTYILKQGMHVLMFLWLLLITGSNNVAFETPMAVAMVNLNLEELKG